MSNNVATNTKNEGRCSFSRKALSVATAAVLATSMVPMLPAESAWAGEASALAFGNADEAWSYAKVNWSVDKDAYGRYVATMDKPMLVKSVIDEFGKELDSSEYVVMYFVDSDNSGTLSNNDLAVTNSVNGVVGQYPKTAGNYVAVVFSAADWAQMKADHTTVGNPGAEGDWFDGDGNPLAGFGWGSHMSGYAQCKSQAFRIDTASEAKSLEGAFAFEVDSNETSTANNVRKDFADTTFKYLGKSINVDFALDGKGLTAGTDYVVSWTCNRSDISAPAAYGTNSYTLPANAATYTATLYGIGDYAGSEETVTITVDPIDLSKDTIAVETVATSSAYNLGDTAGADIANNNIANVTVNGEKLDTNAQAAIKMVATKFEGLTGAAKVMPHSNTQASTDANYVAAGSLGIYTFELSSEYKPAGNPEVVGSTSTSGLVVGTVAGFNYGSNPVDNNNNGVLDAKSDNAAAAGVFVLGDKDFFDSEELEATLSSGTVDQSKFSYKVTKDGKEVTSYDEPGTYVLTLDYALTDGFAAAGHKVVSFTVVEPSVTIDKMFLQADGKALDGNYYYTGTPYEITVACYDDKGNFLTEGKDFTVEVKDAKGNKVESVVDAGTYYVFVTAKGAVQSSTADGTFVVKEAPVKSAKADQAIYAYTKDVIEPTFTGYTKDDLTGLSLALNADNAKITYKKWDGKSYTKDADDNDVIDWSKSTVVPADELKEVGTYQATIDLPQGFKNFADATPLVTAVFQISEKAAFSDVSANAWYAESVYSAADFGYMTGIDGTKLFMPESDITRAQVAEVFFKMAGGEKADAGTEFPTRFSDVENAAWYSQAISWASQAGIVGGYEGTDVFGTFDNATREQIATMIYRYAAVAGMDTTVEDEAKALSAYSDAGQLTFGKTAMAWCVEQGIMGVDTDSLRPGDYMSRAEMAATAVRVQPEAIA